VTIETKYAAELLMQSDSMAKTADYVSLSSLGYVLTAVPRSSIARLRTGRQTTGDGLWPVWASVIDVEFVEIGPVAQLVRAHA
jgi:hypothetical protein